MFPHFYDGYPKAIRNNKLKKESIALDQILAFELLPGLEVVLNRFVKKALNEFYLQKFALEESNPVNPEFNLQIIGRETFR